MHQSGQLAHRTYFNRTEYGEVGNVRQYVDDGHKRQRDVDRFWQRSERVLEFFGNEV